MTASRSLAINRRRIHALGNRATRSESVHGPTAQEPRAGLMVDQGRERIDRLAAPQIVDVDHDVIRAQERREATPASDRAAVEEDEPARRGTRADAGL